MFDFQAQHIKNFKSQRWQMLLNFNARRRLLLTGTPLQNSLMELWSLMHFLMPHVFASHRDFKDWFSNPLTEMIEGSQEYNMQTVQRLHKVRRHTYFLYPLVFFLLFSGSASIHSEASEIGSREAVAEEGRTRDRVCTFEATALSLRRFHG